MAADPHASPLSDSDEPKTPLWLTFLGGALFLLAAVYLLVTREPDAPSPPSAGAELAP